MRLIDSEALKEEIIKNKKVAGRFIEGVIMLIDNAPTVSYPFYTEAYQTGFKEAKSKIIHSITEQYKAHNKLIPIWLSIGDIKDDVQ